MRARRLHDAPFSAAEVVTVQFTVQTGTTNGLVNVGVSDASPSVTAA
jgi:hypothetical protein